jgi:hypothetical protein
VLSCSSQKKNQPQFGWTCLLVFLRPAATRQRPSDLFFGRLSKFSEKKRHFSVLIGPVIVIGHITVTSRISADVLVYTVLQVPVTLSALFLRIGIDEAVFFQGIPFSIIGLRNFLALD